MEAANIVFRVYPDQNVWDYMLKGNIPQVSIKLPDGNSYPVEYIYSSTTLDELERIVDSDQRDLFLKFIKDISAKYISVDFETEKACFQSIDPYKQYSSHIENKASTKEIVSAFQDFSYQMLSGDNSRTIEDIWNTIFGDLSKMLKKSLSEINNIDDRIKEDLTSKIKSFDEYTNKLIELLPIIIPKSQIKPLKAIKAILPYDYIEINNLKAENAVKIIWEKVKKLYESEDDLDEKVEQVFEKIYGNNKNPKKKWKMLEKINAVYMFLNMSGYWQDENLDKRRKFIPSINDASHAFYAAYSNLFMTRDFRLSKKLEAVYSYYDIETKVFYYNEKIT